MCELSSHLSLFNTEHSVDEDVGFGVGDSTSLATQKALRSEPDGPARANCPRQFLQSPAALLSAGLIPEHQFPTTDIRSRVLSGPEDVLDALESDLTVEDVGRPVEVFAITDEAPEKFQGRPQMGRRVVLVPQSADGTPRSHHDVSCSETARWTGTASQQHQPMNHWVRRPRYQMSMGGGTISEEASMCSVPGGVTLVGHCGLHQHFSSPAMCHASPLRFLSGGYRAAMRLALQEIAHGVERNDEISSDFSCHAISLCIDMKMILLLKCSGSHCKSLIRL